MLKFLGRGGAFFTKEGNTSSYFIEDKQLFLIDCGETVFSCLIERGILDDVDQVHVLITHTHPDHIGSLGSLIFYMYYIKQQQLNILIDKCIKHVPNIKQILTASGVDCNMFRFVPIKEYDNRYKYFNCIRYSSTMHVDVLDSYSIFISTDQGVVYYSGDTKDSKVIQSFIESGEVIKKIYIEATTVEHPNNVHMPLRLLDEIIPHRIREKVFCMHFNNEDCMIRAKELGFQIAEVS